MVKKESKYITSIKNRVNKRIEKLRYEAHLAFLDWADSGYVRYSKKQERLEAEADELEMFIHPEIHEKEVWQIVAKEKEEKEKLIRLLKFVSSVTDDMKYSFPDCSETRRLEEIVNIFKYEHLNKLQ